LSSRKQLGAYYTPASVVEAALDAVAALGPAPRRVLDLACGDGAWLVAAAARWPDAALEGVDLDEQAVRTAVRRLGGRAQLRSGDGLVLGVDAPDLIVGNPPWGAGRARRVRRGEESASRFVERAIDLLPPGGRVCLVLPHAWLEVAAHRCARAQLVEAVALERVEPLGDVFPGVFAPAALVIARREPDAARRDGARVWTPRGAVTQRRLVDSGGALNPRLSPRERALLAKLDARAEHLRGRVRFILGVVTGSNRTALVDGPDGDEDGGDDRAGEPIVTGPDVTPLRIRAPRRRLTLPLERVQQAAPRSAYARPKVVYRFISRHPIAAVDRAGRLTLNSANAFSVEDPALDPSFWPEFAAGVLNSTPLKFAHAARVTLPRVLRSHLETLPLPRATDRQRRAIARLAARGDAAGIDELVMDLFALSDAERANLREAAQCPPS
jgi:predicted RNA methylase